MAFCVDEDQLEKSREIVKKLQEEKKELKQSLQENKSELERAVADHKQVNYSLLYHRYL